MIDRDYLETLKREIDDLKKRVAKLENQNKPVVPIYNAAQFPIDAVEGQIVIAS